MIYNNSTGSQPLYGGPNAPSAPSATNSVHNYVSDERYDYSNSYIPPPNMQHIPYGHAVPQTNQLHETPYADQLIRTSIPTTVTYRSLCIGSCPFFVLLLIQIILISISLPSPWFSYCYFAFGLIDEKKIVHGDIDKGDGHNTIVDLYDEVCEPDKDTYNHCPHFCRSIKEVRHSGDIMLGCGITSIIVVGLLMLLTIIKIKRKRAKIPKFMFYFLGTSSLLIYLIGFIIYYRTSKFTSFHTVDDNSDRKPKYFAWNIGIGLTTPVLIINFLSICITKSLLKRLYN